MDEETAAAVDEIEALDEDDETLGDGGMKSLAVGNAYGAPGAAQCSWNC